LQKVLFSCSVVEVSPVVGHSGVVVVVVVVVGVVVCLACKDLMEIGQLYRRIIAPHGEVACLVILTRLF